MRNASAQLGLLICGKSGYVPLFASFTEGETGVACHSRPRGTPIIGEKCTPIDASFKAHQRRKFNYPEVVVKKKGRRRH
jgi:hypothetical protein